MIPLVYFITEDPDEPVSRAADPEPSPKPQPVICAEVWRTEPVNAERAWAATKAMCGGGA